MTGMSKKISTFLAWNLDPYQSTGKKTCSLKRWGIRKLLNLQKNVGFQQSLAALLHIFARIIQLPWYILQHVCKHTLGFFSANSSGSMDNGRCVRINLGDETLSKSWLSSKYGALMSILISLALAKSLVCMRYTISCNHANPEIHVHI